MQQVLASLQFTGYEYLESIGRRAVDSQLIPETLAEDCSRCCERRFGSWMRRSLSRRESAQLEAYFNAVVRGKVTRSRGTSLAEMRCRLVIRSLAEDLIGAGVEQGRVISEIVETLQGRTAHEEVVQVLASMSLGRAS